MDEKKINILLVEDNKDFAKLVQVYLRRFDKDAFSVVWKENHAEAIAELETNQEIDIVLMDYFLPGKNGLEITKEMRKKNITTPVVFLTVNKDFDLAVDVMKVGIDDYLVKEEISSPVLPKTVLSVIEKRRLKDQLMGIEISRQRLQAIHETLARVIKDFETPLVEMKRTSGSLRAVLPPEIQKNFVKIIEENVARIADKLEKLRSLKVDRTIKYIKDIRMIDLS
ncbi:MAG TPA: response regulator [Bacteroidota bacterium]